MGSPVHAALDRELSNYACLLIWMTLVFGVFVALIRDVLRRL